MHARSRVSLPAASGVGWFLPLLVFLVPVPARSASEAQLQSGVVTSVQGSTLPAAISIRDSLGALSVGLTPGTRFCGDSRSSDVSTFSSAPQSLEGRFVTAVVDPQTFEVTCLRVETRFRARGVVVNVSRRTAPATVRIDTGFGGPLALRVTDGTEVASGMALPDNLRDLVGGCVTVSYDPDTLAVATLEQTPRLDRLVGRLTGVEPETTEVSVENDHFSLTFRAGPAAFGEDGVGGVTLDGIPATMSDLRPGQEVAVYYADNGAGAVWIEARSAQTSRVTGTLTRAAGSSRTLVLDSSRARGGLAYLKVTPATVIHVNGHAATLSQVPARGRITARVAFHHGLAVARTLTVSSAHR